MTAGNSRVGFSVKEFLPKMHPFNASLFNFTCHTHEERLHFQVGSTQLGSARLAGGLAGGGHRAGIGSQPAGAG